jgi:hypothetical protein
MKLIRVRNANGIDMQVNVDRITYIISAGNEQYYVYFSKDDKITVTAEGMEALSNTADEPRKW